MALPLGCPLAAIQTMTEKIIITGCTCAGKTTLGQKLAQKLGISQLDLDEYHFLPNWVEKEKEQFVEDVLAALENKETWIVSGNYNSLMKDSVWSMANRVIWLDYPLGLILHRYFQRTFRRVVYKEKCCGDNYETLGRTFSSESLFLRIFKSYWKRKERMQQWMHGPFADKQWVVLRSPKQTSKYLNTL